MGPLVIASAAAWGYTYLAGKYNVGGGAYMAVHTIDKYRQAILEAIGNKIDETFKQMQVRREPSKDNKIVFSFKKVHIVNSDEIDKQIKEEIEKKATATAQTGIIPPKIGQPKTVTDLTKVLSPEEYELNLTIDDPNISLGEIDFCDWEKRKDFHIEIKLTGSDTALGESDPRYKSVLETLKKFAKVSAKEDFPLDKATKIPENNMGNWLWSWLPGTKNTVQAVNLLGGLNEHILTPQYIAGIQQSAIDKAIVKGEDKKDKSILPNYFGVIEHAKKNELLQTIQLRKKLEAEKAARAISRSGLKFLLITGLVLLATIAAIVLVNIFAPGVGAIITPIILSAFTGIASFVASKLFSIPGGILGAGLLSAALVTWWKTKPEWDKTKAKVLDSELEDVKKNEEELNHDLENIKQNKLAAEKTLDAIVKLHESKGDTLDLACKSGTISKFLKGTLGKLFGSPTKDQIDNMAVDTICMQLCNTGEKAVLKTCTTINLENNSITKEGAIILANTIVNAQTSSSFNLQKIYLAGNPIEKEGLEELHKAMKQNFTIVDLTYSIPSGMEKENAEKFKNDMDEQLLINRKLQGKLETSDNKHITTLFGSTEEFNKAVLAKVKTNASIITIPGPEPKAPLTEDIQNVLKQNIIFMELSSPKSSTSKGPTLDGYLKAVEIDAIRCSEFMKVNENNESTKDMINKIRQAIAQDILMFSGIDCAPTLKNMFPEPRKPDTTKNIDLFAKIMAKLPKEKDSAISTGMIKYIQSALTVLNGSSHENFVKDLEKNRSEIATDPGIKDQVQRRAMLNILDTAIHPELAKDEGKLNIYQIQKLVIDQPAPIAAFAEFMQIYNKVDKKKFMLAISTTDSLLDPKTRKNLGLLITLTEKLPNWQSNPQMLDTLEKAFIHASTQETKTFEKKLENKRTVIAKDSKIDETRRKECLSALDTTLHPTLDGEQLSAYQLKKLTIEHPDINLEKTFEEFTEIYKKVLPKNIDSVLPKEDLEAFKTLIRADIYNGSKTVFTQLRKSDLSREHKQALLELCFKDTNDPDYKKKATLLVEILSNETTTKLFLDNDKMAKFREEYLSWVVTWPSRVLPSNWVGEYKACTYKELKTALEVKRKEIAQEGKPDKAMLETVDSILSLEFKDDPEKLTLYRLGKLIDEHPSIELNKTFEEFVGLCKKIPANKIASIHMENPDKLIELVRADVYDSIKGKTLFTQLRKSDLSKEQKQALLELCFKTSKDPDYENKAKLLAEILSNEKTSEMFLDNNDMEDIRNNLSWAFTWPPLILPSFMANDRGPRTYAQLVEGLTDKRKTIAQNGEISTEKRRAMLNILDSELNPILGKTDSLPFKAYQLQKLVIEHPTNDDKEGTKKSATFTEFMSIYNTIKGEKLDSLYQAPPLSADAKENLKTFIAIVQKLPESVSGTATKMLEENFKQLNKNPAAFNKALDESRKKIAIDEDIPNEHKRVVFAAIDLTMGKDLKEGISLAKHQLQKMLDGQRVADTRKAFKELVEIYKTIPEKELGGFFANMKVDELIKLVKDDVYNSSLGSGHKTVCTELRKMDEPHRLPLLEACFGNPENYPEDKTTYKDKAALVSKMITVKSLFSETDKDRIQDFREYQLQRSFFDYTSKTLSSYKSHTYVELKRLLDERRKLAKNLGTEEGNVAAEVLDEIFQADLQRTLENSGKYSCLKSGTDGFVELKEALKGNRELRRFEFPKDMDPSVTAYIKSVTNGNRLNDAFSDYPTEKEQVNRFLEVYNSIHDTKERNDALLQFLTIEGNTEKLKALDKEYEGLEQIIQTSLQLKLIAEHPCLEGPEITDLKTLGHKPGPFESLRTALQSPGYQDLVDEGGFGFTNNKKVNEGIQKYVSNVCQLRQKLASDEPDLASFIKNFQSIPSDYCEDAANSIDKDKIWKLISDSLGDKEEQYNPNLNMLRNLDSSHRIALLARCFSINDTPADAREKAIIISNLIGLGEKLDDEDMANSRYYVYWAIKDYGHNKPYYNLNDTLNSLIGKNRDGKGYLPERYGSKEEFVKLKTEPDKVKSGSNLTKEEEKKEEVELEKKEIKI